MPFGRSRNRRTVKHLDFLLDEITNRYPSLTDEEYLLRQTQLEAHTIANVDEFEVGSVQYSNRHDQYQMGQVIQNVQQSQKKC